MSANTNLIMTLILHKTIMYLPLFLIYKFSLISKICNKIIHENTEFKSIINMLTKCKYYKLFWDKSPHYIINTNVLAKDSTNYVQILLKIVNSNNYERDKKYAAKEYIHKLHHIFSPSSLNLIVEHGYLNRILCLFDLTDVQMEYILEVIETQNDMISKSITANYIIEKIDVAEYNMNLADNDTKKKLAENNMKLLNNEKFIWKLIACTLNNEMMEKLLCSLIINKKNSILLNPNIFKLCAKNELPERCEQILIYHKTISYKWDWDIINELYENYNMKLKILLEDYMLFNHSEEKKLLNNFKNEYENDYEKKLLNNFKNEYENKYEINYETIENFNFNMNCIHLMEKGPLDDYETNHNFNYSGHKKIFTSFITDYPDILFENEDISYKKFDAYCVENNFEKITFYQFKNELDELMG